MLLLLGLLELQGLGECCQVLALFFGPAVCGTIAIKAALEVFDQTFWKGKAHLVVESNCEVAVSWCSRPA